MEIGLHHLRKMQSANTLWNLNVFTYVRLRINMVIMFKTENQWTNKMELIFIDKENEDFLVSKD